jgi:hypothetical protein
MAILARATTTLGFPACLEGLDFSFTVLGKHENFAQQESGRQNMPHTRHVPRGSFVPDALSIGNGGTKCSNLQG